MKYTIIIDKQPSTNPSEGKKEYVIDIEELRTYQGVSDTLKVTPDMAYVIRRLSLSEYGVLSILDEPKQENLKDLNIELFEGTNYVYILNEQGNKISASYIIKSEFTDTYPTKAEMNSAITQSAQSIEISVNTKLEGYSTTEEMNSAIKITADAINSEVSKKVGEDEVCSVISQSADEILLKGNRVLVESDNFILNKNGEVTAKKINITGGEINLTGEEDAPKISITDTNNSNNYIQLSYNTIKDIFEGKLIFYLTPTLCSFRAASRNDNTIIAGGYILLNDALNTTNISLNAEDGEVKCIKLNQTSLESIKKNISHYNENALETILNSDIYTYNLKSEKDTDKKHIGFVIGDKYKTPKEVMNNEGNAIELYSAIGILWKGMQEQQKKIEELENKLKEVTNG